MSAAAFSRARVFLPGPARRPPSPHWRSPATAGGSPPPRRAAGPRTGERSPVAGADGTEIRSAHTGRLVARLPTDDQTRSVAFSPDGKLVATGEFNGRLLLWSTHDWRPVGRAVEAHQGRGITLGLSPASRTPPPRPPARGRGVARS